MVVTKFASQTGIQVIYLSENANGRMSQGVQGGLSPPATVAAMLNGTGLDFQFLNDRTVRIYSAHNSPSVTEMAAYRSIEQRADVGDADSTSVASSQEASGTVSSPVKANATQQDDRLQE